MCVLYTTDPYDHTCFPVNTPCVSTMLMMNLSVSSGYVGEIQGKVSTFSFCRDLIKY